MRSTGVWMVSVDQDHAFPGRHLLQLGTRLGYSTIGISRIEYRIEYGIKFGIEFKIEYGIKYTIEQRQ